MVLPCYVACSVVVGLDSGAVLRVENDAVFKSNICDVVVAFAAYAAYA